MQTTAPLSARSFDQQTLSPRTQKTVLGRRHERRGAEGAGLCGGPAVAHPPAGGARRQEEGQGDAAADALLLDLRPPRGRHRVRRTASLSAGPPAEATQV